MDDRLRPPAERAPTAGRVYPPEPFVPVARGRSAVNGSLPAAGGLARLQSDEISVTSTLEPYFLGLNRAMVSLGPLAGQVYCTFKCTFCYVNGPYQRYARRSVDDVLG